MGGHLGANGVRIPRQSRSVLEEHGVGADPLVFGCPVSCHVEAEAARRRFGVSQPRVVVLGVGERAENRVLNNAIDGSGISSEKTLEAF
jgi:hypothetical protein